eukprot:gnl/MRDRNA2_/MRDRNA2_38020_c0_seq1.p1 gnl/MRDRNA2_/MRDRNA2_38020_c0~~gnl/MRDRNA2_/MRDRNA2_38020_c0_seq1.p1  ORF type:complete len:302 (-),score=35.65 gnl/MRDRNA2_/MRDRNA2_38020_c0_seq1:225-1040(-)
MIDVSLLEQNTSLPPLAVAERPMLLPYRGIVSRLWNDVSPFGIQQIESGVHLFEDLPVSPSWAFAQICMTPPLHMHHADLRFHSKLSMMKSFLRHRPLLGGIVFIAICTSLAAVFMGVLLVWAILSYFSQEPPLHKEPEWDETQLETVVDDSESTDHVFADPLEPESQELSMRAENSAALMDSSNLEDESFEGLSYTAEDGLATSGQSKILSETQTLMVPGGVASGFLTPRLWRPGSTPRNVPNLTPRDARPSLSRRTESSRNLTGSSGVQ